MSMFLKKKTKPTGYRFLNIGTRILSRDIMDQFIRSCGEHETYYASNEESARKAVHQQAPHIVISEFELPDSTAFRFIRDIRADREQDKVYVIMAIEKDSDAHREIAKELDVDSILIKPFTAQNLREELIRYKKKLKDKESVEAIIRAANRAYRDKDTARANQLYRLALDKDSRSIIVQQGLGHYHLTISDYKTAEKHLKLALEMDNQHVPSLNSMGELSLKKKNYKLALSSFSLAQKISPFNPDRASKIAKVHLDWALSELRSVSMQDGLNADLHFELGKMLLYKKDFLSAYREFERVHYPAKHENTKELDAYKQLTKSLGSIK